MTDEYIHYLTEKHQIASQLSEHFVDEWSAHKAFWGKPDYFGSPISEDVEHWFQKLQNDSIPAIGDKSADSGYGAPHLDHEFERAIDEQTEDTYSNPDGNGAHLIELKNFDYQPSYGDFSQGCHFLYTPLTNNPIHHVLYVRKDYVRAEEYITRDRSPVYIVAGSQGEGKSAFLWYLLHRLLQRQKPCLWLQTDATGAQGSNYWLLYCQKGVYKIEETKMDSGLLKNPGARGLFVLVDGNWTNEVPFIKKAGSQLKPTVVFATSPKLNLIWKSLSDQMQDAYKVFVMNPWTLFELEMMSVASKAWVSACPSWSETKRRILDFGPIPRHLWPCNPRDLGEIKDVDFGDHHVRSALNNIKDLHTFIYSVQQASNLADSPNTDVSGVRSLFLVSRMTWDADPKKDYEKRRVSLLSLRVFAELSQHFFTKLAEDRKREIATLMPLAGCEAMSGVKFQVVCLDKWLDQRRIGFDRCRLCKVLPQSKSYTSDGVGIPFVVAWDQGKEYGILNNKFPNVIQCATFYYEAVFTARSPFVDAVFVEKDMVCKAFQITRSEKHPFSITGLKTLCESLPKGVKKIEYILVQPPIRKAVAKIGPNDIKLAQESMAKYQMEIDFFVAVEQTT